MGGTLVLDLWQGALITTVTVATPFIIAALVVGVLMSLVQAATQLQEAALSFVPKVAALGFVLSIGGHWALGQLVRCLAASMNSFSSIGASP